MSSRQLRQLASVLAIVLVVWAALALVRRSDTDRSVSFSLPKVDTAAVDSVAITRPGDTLVLARAAKGAWSVNGKPASSTAVNALLRGLADTLFWSELVAELPRSHARFGVDSAEGRRLRVSSHGKVLLDILSGKQTTDYGGIYVRRVDHDPVYALHSPLGDALTRGDDDWRDKHVATVVPESVSTVAVQRGGRSYLLRRSGNSWTFAGGGATDSASVASLLGQYQSVTATGFASPAQRDSIDFTHARRRVRLTGRDGRALVSLAWDSTASGVWLRADSAGEVFRTDAWTMDQLTPADSTLRARKKKP